MWQTKTTVERKCHASEQAARKKEKRQTEIKGNLQENDWIQNYHIKYGHTISEREQPQSLSYVEPSQYHVYLCKQICPWAQYNMYERTRKVDCQRIRKDQTRGITHTMKEDIELFFSSSNSAMELLVLLTVKCIEI